MEICIHSDSMVKVKGQLSGYMLVGVQLSNVPIQKTFVAGLHIQHRDVSAVLVHFTLHDCFSSGKKFDPPNILAPLQACEQNNK